MHGCLGPRTLESPLKHCDSAQRASTGQPGATPNGTYFVFVVPPSGGNRHSGPCEFRLKAVLQTSEPGAAFIRIRGFSCPRLICASLSGSITASIKYYSFVVRGRPCTSFRAEPKTGPVQCGTKIIFVILVFFVAISVRPAVHHS